MSEADVSTAAHRVKIAGAVILVAGLVAAGMAYVRAVAPEDVDAVEQRREMVQVERIGGTAAVRTVKFDAWLASLWTGERLAWTLGVLAVVVGGGCFYVGGLMGEDVGTSPRR